MQSIYKNIIKELRIISAKSHALRVQADLAKQKAILEYRKLQLIKERKSVEHVNHQLENLTSTSKPPTKFEHLFKQLFKESQAKTPTPNKIQAQHFKNIHDFLNSQRTYQELIERYNPGLTMDQGQKVEKTANRVGLKVPN